MIKTKTKTDREFVESTWVHIFGPHHMHAWSDKN
jgi:hypothetical protein